jgi:hypothetical protein
MGAPVCTAAVGIEVGVAAGAEGAGWTWPDACGFEVGLALWPVEDGGVFAGLGEAAGAWLTVGWAAAGTVLWLGAGGLGGATAGMAFACGDTCAVAGAGGGTGTWLGIVRLAGIVPLLFGVAVLLVRAFAPARWLLLTLLAFAELPMLPMVALPPAFAEAVAPCAPAFPFLPAVPAQSLATVLLSLLLLPPALWLLPATPPLLPPALVPP